MPPKAPTVEKIQPTQVAHRNNRIQLI